MQLNGVVIALGAAVLLFVGAAGPARAADGSLTPARASLAVVPAPARALADDKDDKKDDKTDEKLDQVKLPNGAICDVTALEGRFKILKVKIDAVNGKVSWIMEAKEEINSITAAGTLYDEDEVRIGPATVLIEPNAYIKVGDHVRFILDLPAEAVLKKVKKISVK